MTHKTIRFLLPIIVLAGCRHDSFSYLNNSFLTAQECMAQGDLENALHHYKVSARLALEDENYPVYWKALSGEGEIYLRTHQLQDAEEDFSRLLDIAQDHHLDTAEYIARLRLGVIAYRKGDYGRSVTYFTQARETPAARHFQGLLTRDLIQEMELASAAQTLQTGNLTDNAYRRLEVLAQDTDLRLKTEALKLLALQEGKNHQSAYTAPALQLRDSLKYRELYEYDIRTSREKALWEKEYKELKIKQQNTLFTIFMLFTGFIGCCIALLLRYRNKHELDHIRLILHQKEQAIRFLENKQDDLVKLRSQIQKKEKEWDETEQHLRRIHLYDMEIGRRIPTEDNPNKPKAKDFTKLMVDNKAQFRFLEEMNRCFDDFATGLQQTTPNLTQEDVIYCCLFHLNVRTTDIAEMFCRTKSTVSTRRKRIEDKMTTIVQSF